MPTAVRVRIKRFRLQRPGWSIAEVEERVTGQRADGKVFVAIGPLDQVHEGEEADLEGGWVIHPKWGEQFKVTSAMPAVPSD
ncbi:MAG: YrrC family ATP-dependent DNA helicase, partial [Thermoanaerobaculia bacterium]